MILNNNIWQLARRMRACKNQVTSARWLAISSKGEEPRAAPPGGERSHCSGSLDTLDQSCVICKYDMAVRDDLNQVMSPSRTSRGRCWITAWR